MVGFYDVRCEKCSRKFGWCGGITDRPPCPGCGHTIPREELQKQQDMLEALFNAPRDAMGETYRKWRLDAEVLLSTAAKYFGVKASIVSRWEQGLEKPTEDQVASMKVLYKVKR